MMCFIGGIFVQGKLQIGVAQEFVGDGGFHAVSGIGCDVGGEGEDLAAEGMDEGGMVAAWHIGATDAPAEEAVARQEDLLFLAVQAAAAGGVAGGMDDFKGMVAERDGGSLVDVASYAWYAEW